MYNAQNLTNMMHFCALIVDNARPNNIMVQREIMYYADYFRHRLGWTRSIDIKLPLPWQRKFYYNIKTRTVYFDEFCINGNDVVQEVEKKEFLNNICIYYSIYGKGVRLWLTEQKKQ